MQVQHPGHEIGLRSALVQKTGSSRHYQFRDSGDRRRQHDLASQHRLHQNQRNSLAAAGEHHKIGPSVQRIHLLTRHMPEEDYLVLQAISSNQELQTASFRSLAGNRALEIETARSQLGAGADQEGMIFHSMQPSNRQHGKLSDIPIAWNRLRLSGLDSKPGDENLLLLHIRIMLSDVPPVVLRNGQAKCAVSELHVEVAGAQKQVGSVQGHAESRPQETRRHHRHPRSEISMVGVDMVDAHLLQAHGVAGSEQGVQQRFGALQRALPPPKQNPRNQRRNQHPFPEAQPNRSRQHSR